MVSAAAPIFYQDVEYWTTLGVLLAIVVIELVAFINCLMQRADAFPVVGSLSKAAWSAILGGSVLLSVLCITLPGSSTFVAFIGVTAAAIYLLDVRRAIRDATDGTGSW